MEGMGHGGSSGGVIQQWVHGQVTSMVSVRIANQHGGQRGGGTQGEGSSEGANQHKGHARGVKHAEGAKHVEGVC